MGAGGGGGQEGPTAHPGAPHLFHHLCGADLPGVDRAVNAALHGLLKGQEPGGAWPWGAPAGPAVPALWV